MKVLFAQLASKAPKSQTRHPIQPLTIKISQVESRRSRNPNSRETFKSYSLSVKRTPPKEESLDSARSQDDKFKELSIETVTNIDSS